MRSVLCMGYPCNAGELDPLSKYLHCVCCKKEDAKSILYLPLHHPPMNPTISGVHSEARGPFFSRSSLDQGGPVLAGMLSSM